MARDIAELGADVFDDTVPAGKKGLSKKAKNYIVGLSITGAILVALGVGATVLSQTYFRDFDYIPYLDFYYNEPDPVTKEVTATVSKLRKEAHPNYPKNFRIPSQIEGHRITKIDENAFNDCTRLETLSMTNDVEEIGPYAFKNCTNLRSIKFSKKLSYIGSRAFENTLYEQTLPEDDFVVLNDQFIIHVGKNYFKNPVVLLENDQSTAPAGFESYEIKHFSDFAKKSITGFMDGCFEDNSNIVYVELPSTLKSLPDECFYGCDGLEAIDLSKTGVTSLSSSAFKDCSSLSDIYLSNDTITSIGDYCFENTRVESFPDGLDSLKEVGSGVFKNCSELEEFEFPSSLTSIPNETFSGCTSLKTFTFADGTGEKITSVGYASFKGTKIEEFKMPKAVGSLRDKVFEDCTELKKVSLLSNTFEGVSALTPKKVNGKYVFTSKEDEEGYVTYDIEYENAELLDYFSSLPVPAFDRDEETGDYILDEEGNPILLVDSNTGEVMYDSNGTLKGITNMCNSTFKGASKLDTIALYDFDGNEIAGKANDGEINFPATLGTTANAGSDGEVGGAFVGTSAKKVNIPSGLKVIAKDSFNGVTSLETIVFEDNSLLSTIGEHAFKGTSLASVLLPDTVGAISAGAFQDCDKLQEIHLPVKTGEKDMLTLGDYAFAGDNSLSNINFPQQLTKIGKHAFENVALTSVELPARVGTIDNYAFANCSSLVSFKINSPLQELGENAFDGCSSLSSIKLNDGLKKFGKNSFNNCTSLESIVIPATVTTIPNNAFNGCTALSKVFVSATSLPTGYASGWNKDATVYLYSETEQAGCWHYVDDVPTLW